MKNLVYSHKDFTGQDLRSIDPANLNNTEIVNSNFYREGADYADVLPDGAVNVTLIDCNLCNVNIPVGYTVNGGSNDRITKQNDGEGWTCDRLTGVPLEPVNKKGYEALGLSIDPADLPVEEMTESIIIKTRVEVAEAALEV